MGKLIINRPLRALAKDGLYIEVIMQTNINKEDKNIVEVWDWRDFRGDYSPGVKKFYRRLRRRRFSQILDKAIWEAIQKA